jgi:imidazolonepropionase-like amidohydrolase
VKRALALVLAIAASASSAKAADRALLLRAAGYVDVEAGRLVTPATILIRNGVIVSLHPSPAETLGAREINLPRAYLMPGMIDAHTHLLSDKAQVDSQSLLTDVRDHSRADRIKTGAQHAAEMLRAGVTTVRDLGNSGRGGDVLLRDSIAREQASGPRMLVSTRALSPPGGQFGALADAHEDQVREEYAEVRDAATARAATRQAIADGADVIKVIVDARPLMLSDDVLVAIVDEAHRAGRKVAAHANADAAVRAAVRAGVDTIEHAFAAEDATLKDMAQKGVPLVVTNAPLSVLEAIAISPELSPEARAAKRQRLESWDKDQCARLARAVSFGVRIVGGSDAAWTVPGKTSGEVAVLGLLHAHDCGLGAAAVIRTVTVNAAQALGLSAETGTIALGQRADIIAVADDPLSDITTVKRPKLVVASGRVLLAAVTKKAVK